MAGPFVFSAPPMATDPGLVVVSPGSAPAGRSIPVGVPPVGREGGAASLAHQFLGGVNPLPFVVAIVVMGVVMLAFPKAAVPLGIVIVLGALAVDRQALTAFETWQKGQGK
jgi:hypothetical protein